MGALLGWDEARVDEEILTVLEAARTSRPGNGRDKATEPLQ
jgi:hypothetical protein